MDTGLFASMGGDSWPTVEDAAPHRRHRTEWYAGTVDRGPPPMVCDVSNPIPRQPIHDYDRESLGSTGFLSTEPVVRTDRASVGPQGTRWPGQMGHVADEISFPRRWDYPQERNGTGCWERGAALDEARLSPDDWGAFASPITDGRHLPHWGFAPASADGTRYSHPLFPSYGCGLSAPYAVAESPVGFTSPLEGCCMDGENIIQGSATISGGARRLQKLVLSSGAGAACSGGGDTRASGGYSVSESYSLAAVIDNGQREVGVAFCSLPSLKVSITQYGDTCTFAKTLTLIHTNNPVEVLVPITTVQHPFTQTLLQHYEEEITFTSVQRHFFDADRGARRLRELRSTGETTVYTEDINNYLCVAAANALVAYIEQSYGMQLLPGTVCVRYILLDHFAEISRASARALHILPPAHNVSSVALARPSQRARAAMPWAGRGAHSSAPVQDATSLPFPHCTRSIPLILGLPHPCTVMGQRCLRTSLLQPLRDRVAIQYRYDAVSWFMDDPKRIKAFHSVLSRVAGVDVEKIMAMLAQKPLRMTEERMQHTLQSLLHLWGVMESLRELERTMWELLPQELQEGVTAENATAPAPTLSSSPQRPLLLGSIAHTLRACQMTDLLSVMEECMDASVRYAPPSSNGGRGTGARFRGGSDHILGGGDAGGPFCPTRRPLHLRSRASGPHRRNAMDMSHVMGALHTCFVVKAEKGSVLDALRDKFSVQISHIAEYVVKLRSEFHMNSLRLEPDRDRLYSLSYTLAEEVKTAGGPFTYKYAGGGHYPLLMAQLQCERQAALRPSEPTQRSDSTVPSAQGNNTFVFSHSSQDHASDWGGCSQAPPGLSKTGSTGVAGSDTHPHLCARSEQLPQNETQRGRTRRRVRCSTDMLDSLCRGAQGHHSTILKEEMQEVQGLVQHLLRACGKVQAMSEAVALLDTLVSFARYSFVNRCVRPCLCAGDGSTTDFQSSAAPRSREASAVMSSDSSVCAEATPNREDGSTDGDTHYWPGEREGTREGDGFYLLQARHPTEQGVGGQAGLVVPNTIQWHRGVLVLIITGPNMTGKTTLLRQTGQLFALAQSGCFIPVASARIFIADRIVAHMLCDELPVVQRSPFRRELMELSEVSHSVTSDSLVLVDELGRSTATAQGFALAWATVSFFLQVRVHCLCSTHFSGLTEASRIFQEVANFHFELTVTPSTTANPVVAPEGAAMRDRSACTSITCAHRLLPGPCASHRYGITLAQHIGFFPPVLQWAEYLMEAEEHIHRGRSTRGVVRNEEGTPSDSVGKAVQDADKVILERTDGV